MRRTEPIFLCAVLAVSTAGGDEVKVINYCSTRQECRMWAHDGTYVDRRAKEINTKILFLCEYAPRSKQIAESIHSQVSPRAESTDHLPNQLAGQSSAYPSFSFLPRGLGQIRGFQVRVHVGASDGPHEPSALDAAILGASAIVITTGNAPADYRRLVERVLASPAYFPKTPIVLFIDDIDADAAAAVKVASVSAIVSTTPGQAHDSFSPLKVALKLALERLKEPPASPPAASRPVAITPLLELLTLEQKRKERPLTKDEVLTVRDHANFILLSLDKANEIERTRGYRDLDPDKVWEQWQRARAK